MADKTIEWLHAIRAQDANKPFFTYFSTGCSHAPHHVSQEWAAKYKGKFDQGWDKLREETFARQKALGGFLPMRSSHRATRRSPRGTTSPTS
jgi:arylsulfatase